MSYFDLDLIWILGRCANTVKDQWRSFLVQTSTSSSALPASLFPGGLSVVRHPLKGESCLDSGENQLARTYLIAVRGDEN